MSRPRLPILLAAISFAIWHASVGAPPAARSAAVAAPSAAPATLIAAPPAFQAVVTCYNGWVDSGSYTCVGSFRVLSAQSAWGNPIELICGLPNQQSKLTWQFLGTEKGVDLYRFSRVFPVSDAHAQESVRNVSYSGKRVVIYKDKFQAIVLDSGPDRDGQKQVDKQLARYAESIRRMRFKTTADLFTEEGEIVNPGAEPIHGRETIRGFLDSFSQYRVTAYSIKSGSTVIQYTHAHQEGFYQETLLDPDGHEIKAAGKFLAMWVRDAGGDWYIERMITMADRDGAASTSRPPD